MLRESSNAESSCDYKLLASLVDHIRLSSFPTLLEQYIQTQCSFDTCLILVFKASCSPILLSPTDPTEHSTTLQAYLKHAYVLDPLFNALPTFTKGGVCRLKEIAPDSFRESEYYQTCYKNFDLFEEVNLIIPLQEEMFCTISLGRKAQLGSITRGELTRLKETFPFISALLNQYWLVQGDSFYANGQSNHSLTRALQSFGRGVLTQREQEIAGLLLQGHSSKAIADQLGISLATVKVHRKNIHARLNTTSQSEIFTLFLTHLQELSKN
jgi:DNA-binding CsgD family transcriptional regulator